MKNEVKVNYHRSGVKTLEGLAVFFMVIAALFFVIAFIIFLITISSYLPGGVDIIISIIVSALFMLFASGVCYALSSIALTALYKRTLMEQNNTFKRVYTTAHQTYITPTSQVPNQPQAMSETKESETTSSPTLINPTTKRTLDIIVISIGVIILSVIAVYLAMNI